MKVAIVHDWLVTYAGAERVLEQMFLVFPEADLFAVVDNLREEERGFVMGKSATTTFLQKIPFFKKSYRSLLPLMPLAVEQLDMSPYDLVISSSHAVAKGVLTGPRQLHICMCYSPMRYAWELQHQYLQESGLRNSPKAWLIRWMLHKLRVWDLRAATGVDEYIAISKFIERRIYKVYRRNSTVIYPPVYVDDFFPGDVNKKDYYLTSSRMVPYKRIDLIVKVFTECFPKKHLIVIGDGPEFKKIKNIAGSNVKLMGYQPFEVLKTHLQGARAFIFASEEDFGIAPLEAQAAGTPVIAFNRGGATETIVGTETGTPTGVFFDEQSVSSLSSAIEAFEAKEPLFSSESCIKNAKRFSEDRFRSEFKKFVDEAYQKWRTTK